MNTASIIIVEGGLRTLQVTLHNPMSLGAIWDLFAKNGCRPQAITLCKGTARVTLPMGELT